jgi:hypothetical protein
MSLTTVKCAGCCKLLLLHQVARGYRYCSVRCANRSRTNPDSLRQAARRLGVAYTTLMSAIKAGRYHNGVIVPKVRPRLARPDSIAGKAEAANVSRPTYYQAMREGRICEDGSIIPAKKGRPRKR